MIVNVIMTFTVVFVGVGVFAGVIWLAERKAVAELKGQQFDEEMRRLKDALDADARARERAKSGGLYENDGHRRD